MTLSHDLSLVSINALLVSCDLDEWEIADALDERIGLFSTIELT
jgi:hypothetical protein